MKQKINFTIYIFFLFFSYSSLFGTNKIPWLSKIPIYQLPLQLIIQHTKQSKYLIKPISEIINLKISENNIIWKKKNGKKITISKKGIESNGKKNKSVSGSRIFETLLNSIKYITTSNYKELDNLFSLTSSKPYILTAIPLDRSIKFLDKITINFDSTYSLKRIFLESSEETSTLEILKIVK